MINNTNADIAKKVTLMSAVLVSTPYNLASTR